MKLKNLLQLLEAGGEKAGEIEIVETKASIAKRFLMNLIKDSDGFDSFLESFEYNYDRARELASEGYAKRIDMPVIDIEQINGLQMKLEKGMLDAVDGETNVFHKAFPNGLSGAQAEEWLVQGLHDGYETDDIISTSLEQLEAGSLTPIQEQIYFDKAVKKLIEYGVDDTVEFLQNDSMIIVSKDGYILDGHHRWLTAMLIDHTLEIQAMVIGVEKDKLIKLLNAFSDAIGNERNK